MSLYIMKDIMKNLYINLKNRWDITRDRWDDMTCT